MEEKKRWRPSLTAYRELERKLAQEVEVADMLSVEVKSLRLRCSELEAEVSRLKGRGILAKLFNLK